MNDERFLKDWLRDTTDDIPDAQASADRVLARVPETGEYLCRIEEVKPAVCRNYPGSRKYGLMTGCRGFDGENGR